MGFYFLNLFNIYFLDIISIADLALIGIIIFYISVNKGKLKFVRNKYNIVLILFLIIIFLSGIINILNKKNYFIINSFILSYIKLLTYSFLFLFITPLISLKLSDFNRIIYKSLLIISLLGIYQFIAYHFIPFFPYSFNFNTNFINIPGSLDTMFSYGNNFRIQSIFSEPSIFSIYSILLYSYLLHYKVHISKTVHLIVNVSLFLSFSLSGIGLLIINYCILLLKNIKNKKIVLYLIIFIMIILIIFVTNDYLSNRIIRLINLSEGSSATRIVGAWEAALKSPIYGVGLGNLTNFFNTLDPSTLRYHRSGSGVHNTFAAIFMTSGYIGLFLFVTVIMFLFRYNPFYGLFFIASCFGWGYFNSLPVWFILSAVSANNYNLIRRKYNEKNQLSIFN